MKIHLEQVKTNDKFYGKKFRFCGFRIRENMWWTRYRPTAVTIHQFVSILFHGICHMEHKVRVTKLGLWRFNLHILHKVHLYHFLISAMYCGQGAVQWKSWNFLHHSSNEYHSYKYIFFCKNEPALNVQSETPQQ